MTFFHALILGTVEGVTEFLPISSTGHLILMSRLFGIADDQFTKSFEIIIQLGAILAVVVLYWRCMVRDLELWKRLIVAFLPTGVSGFLLYPFITRFLLASDAVVVWSLFLGGSALIFFDWWYRKRDQHGAIELSRLSFGTAFAIGLFQSLALVPGVSRSAATIVGGLLLGINRADIVVFSFLLAVPTMVAATGFDAIQSADTFSSDQVQLLTVGFVVSFLVAIVSIRWFLRFLTRHTFSLFGVYRIAASLIFWFFVLR